MTHASEQRYTTAGVDTKNEAIVATDEWYDALKNLPFKSCKYALIFGLMLCIFIEKNGKTLHLLKQKAKST